MVCVWGTNDYGGLRAIHVAIAGISILRQPYPSGFREAAASGCVEGFGYDSFGGRGVCKENSGRMTGTPRRESLGA